MMTKVPLEPLVPLRGAAADGVMLVASADNMGASAAAEGVAAAAEGVGVAAEGVGAAAAADGVGTSRWLA